MAPNVFCPSVEQLVAFYIHHEKEDGHVGMLQRTDRTWPALKMKLLAHRLLGCLHFDGGAPGFLFLCYERGDGIKLTFGPVVDCCLNFGPEVFQATPLAEYVA